MLYSTSRNARWGAIGGEQSGRVAGRAHWHAGAAWEHGRRGFEPAGPGRIVPAPGFSLFFFITFRLLLVSISALVLWEVVYGSMIKIKSYVVIAFCYRKANILRKWSKILHFCYWNKGLCHGCRSH